MSVKYSLISEEKSAEVRYLWKNVMYNPITKTRAHFLGTARSQYVKHCATEKSMQLKRKHKKDNEHEKVKYRRL